MACVLLVVDSGQAMPSTRRFRRRAQSWMAWVPRTAQGSRLNVKTSSLLLVFAALIGVTMVISWFNMIVLTTTTTSILQQQQQGRPHPIEHPGFDSSLFVTKRGEGPPPPSKHETSRYNMSSIDTRSNANDGGKKRRYWKQKHQPTHHACEDINVNGVLHIESGDEGAAAGTVFFQYVFNQLIYADMYNLKPFVHLNNISKHVYDPIIHSGNSGSSNVSNSGSTTVDGAKTPATTSFTMLDGLSVQWISDGPSFGSRGGRLSYPGRPKPALLFDGNDTFTKVADYSSYLSPRVYTLHGTGIWNHYFEPVSDFAPGDMSCQTKPLIKMHYYQLRPSLLYSCPWSIKSWPYSWLPGSLKPRSGLRDWYKAMRQSGSNIAKKYLKFQPHIIELANKANPPISSEPGGSDGSGNQSKDESQYEQCLAMHIRHSDKGGLNRKRIELESFLPYAEAYKKAGGKRIYIATDSGLVVTTIMNSWPKSVSSLVRIQGYEKRGGVIKDSGKTTVESSSSGKILRSDSKKSVFQLYSHHQTNTEVLVDILALSKCTFFVHGFSAVSEAVTYLNFPTLHDNAVDLELHPQNRPPTPQQFQQTVSHVLKK